MDFLLGTVVYFCVLYGYNTQPTGNFNFVCRDGEELNLCGSPCQLTCENIRKRTRITNCSNSCVAGCFCKNGFVRADDNRCVLPEECFRHECGENEEYLDCGSPCTSNCTNLNQAIFCTKPCQRGCFCKYNFVRNARGKCIHRRNCLAENQQCPPNEEYVTCINFCNTCSKSFNCRTTYCISGCDCKYGYYKNSNGECVTAEECYYSQYDSQPECGRYEIYTNCVNECNDCVSRGRCEYEQFFCSAGCDCRPGYFRNERGVCVPEWNCYDQGPPFCFLDEQYYDCIPRCRNTCDNYDDPDLVCDTTCDKGCFCRTGYVLRQDGECVLPRDCPAKNLPCPFNETFYQCLPTCRTSCRTLNNFTGVCSTNCRPGCFCQPGFVRNDVGRCIRPQDCPASTIAGGDFEGRRGATVDAKNETTTTPIPLTTAKDDQEKETTTAMTTTIKDTTIAAIPTAKADGVKIENSSIPTTTETQGRQPNSSVSDTTTIKTTVFQSKTRISSLPSTVKTTGTTTSLTSPEQSASGVTTKAPQTTVGGTTSDGITTKIAISTDFVNATATNSTT